MDRLEKPDNSSLELLRSVLKGVLTLEQSKSKQTFANLKNGLKKAETQELIPRGMQELIRKETSSLLRETQENIMSKKENIITMKAEDFMSYVVENDGFEYIDIANLFFGGEEGDEIVEKRLAYTTDDKSFPVEIFGNSINPDNSFVEIVGNVIFPDKTFTRVVDLGCVKCLDSISFGGATFKKNVRCYSFYENLVHLNTATFEGGLDLISHSKNKIYFDTAILYGMCEIVANNLELINFGFSKIFGAINTDIGEVDTILFSAATIKASGLVYLISETVHKLDFGTSVFQGSFITECHYDSVSFNKAVFEAKCDFEGVSSIDTIVGVVPSNVELFEN